MNFKMPRTIQGQKSMTMNTNSARQRVRLTKKALASANSATLTAPPFKIDWVRNFGLVDSSRSKTIPLRITYPTTPGKYPVIVFSHGAGNSKEGYKFLIRHWARAGYVCLQPNHEDSVDVLALTHKVPDLMALAMQCTADPVYWLSRVKDIEHILSSLSNIRAQLPPGVSLDEQKIAVAGHSFGAFTAQLIAGATPYIPPGIVPGIAGLVDLSHKVPQAFLFFSPQGVQAPGLGLPNQTAWSQVKRPFMLITGSLDKGLQGQPARWRTEPFQFAPPGDKYLTFVNGADHMTCAGKPAPNTPGSTKSPPDLFSYMASASLCFIEAYLTQNASQKQSLLARDLAKNSAGIVQQDDK